VPFAQAGAPTADGEGAELAADEAGAGVLAELDGVLDELDDEQAVSAASAVRQASAAAAPPRRSHGRKEWWFMVTASRPGG
jgi:hypothetical protein